MSPNCEYLMIYKNLQSQTDTQRDFSASFDQKASTLSLVDGITLTA